MYAVKLEHLEKDYKTVGIKAYNLGQMMREGLPIPTGFVVTVDAFDNFLKANKLKNKIMHMLQKINYNNENSIREISEQVMNTIKEAHIPDYIETTLKNQYEEISMGRELRGISEAAMDLIKAGRDQIVVSVRSSPTTSEYAPNHLKTLLNIRGMGEISDAIKICWASLFTERSLVFRKSKRMTDFPAMGIIVQKMLDVDKSGIIFTSQIEKGDPAKAVIESSWGLGESISQGLVTPDEYIIDKINGNLVEKNIHKKLWLLTKDQLSGKTVRQPVLQDKIEADTLGDGEIKKIWSLSRRIEELYNGQPQMIEWAEERSRLFILETRRMNVNKWNSHLANGEPEPNSNILMTGLGVSPGKIKGKIKLVVNPEDLDNIRQGDIVATRMTDSNMITALSKASAILADDGGRASNASSIANELGIPCIVGLENVTSLLANEQEVFVDATKGKIYEAYNPVPQNNPNGMYQSPYQTPQQNGYFPEQNTPSQPYNYQPQQPPNNGMNPENMNMSDDLTATSIKAIISFPNSASSASEKADGAVLKVEYILTEGGTHPENIAKTNPDQLINNIMKGVEKVAKSFYPKPVWYRSLDATSDIFKQLGGFMEPDESNPLMGWHGIRRSLDRQDVFRCEIEALRRLNQNGLNNIALVLPFVSKLEEFRKVKEMIDFPVKVGIMVETPAVALSIESFCKEGVDFVAIDSTMLAQLILGVDRNNMQIYKLYSEMDPAVISLIKHAVMVCKKYNIEISIYGEAANNPEIIETLIRLGINSISTEIDTIDHIKTVISRTERKLLLDRMRRQHNL